MIGWTHSTQRKVHQRKLNRLIRRINKDIEDDDLWLGRFFIRQHAAEFETYEDKSGGTLHVYLRFYDKKDMKYQEYYGNSQSILFMNGSRLWWKMNNFIVETSSAWKDGDPREERFDYTFIPSDDVVKNAVPYNQWPRSIGA